MAAGLVPIYGSTKNATALLILGPLVAFFGSGYFSGYAAIASELFPTEIRATAMGVSYNIGRIFSALAPFFSCAGVAQVEERRTRSAEVGVSTTPSGSKPM